MGALDQNTKELLSLVAMDYRGTFDRFFRLYYDEVFRFAYYHLGEKEACKEVVSDVFFSIWKSKKRLVDIVNLDTYLFVSVRNRYLARNERKNEIPLEELAGNEIETFESPDEKLGTDELIDALNEAIEKLPDKCRLIFLMARKEGLSPKEIARALSIQESTVRVQLKIAIEKLTAYLKPIFPDITFALVLVLLF